MSEFKPADTSIETQMHCKANDDLKDSVEQDLRVEDPCKEKAKAILSGEGEANESTKGNDGRPSSSDDTESGSTSSAQV